MRARGRFIAFVGLPGSGKSSITTSLAKLWDADPFLEPEEWPRAVSERDVCGHFTGLQWFRSARVPLYFAAEQIRRRGGTAILDSYYDKLCAHWLGAAGMEWLISPSDAYFSMARKIAELDWRRLPLVDALIVLTVDESTWLKFLNARGRKLDETLTISKTYETQEYFRSAALKLEAETGTKIVEFRQKYSSPDDAARRLSTDLTSQGVIASTRRADGELERRTR
jgi:deoxyadenosine/deoxycytidine kinase